MIARTHDLAAITALGVVFLLMPPTSLSLSTAIIAVLANLIGGIAPDIDQPTAPLWRNLPIGRYFGRIFGILIGGHRFLTHSIIGVALVGFLVNLLLTFLDPIMGSIDKNIVWWAFMIGMVSHLIMDTFTKEGVPWLLPIPVKFGIPPVRHLRIITGKKMEMFVVFPLLLIFNCWLYFYFYEEIIFLLRHTITY
jgi:inner membrane protein